MDPLSISSTFYICTHFLYKILAPKITKLCFGFEIFCHQNIVAKCTRKMLMKLTTEVDFTNFYAPICMVKFAKLICRLESARHLPKKLLILFVQKSRANMLVKLTPDCTWPVSFCLQFNIWFITHMSVIGVLLFLNISSNGEPTLLVHCLY